MVLKGSANVHTIPPYNIPVFHLYLYIVSLLPASSALPLSTPPLLPHYFVSMGKLPACRFLSYVPCFDVLVTSLPVRLREEHAKLAELFAGGLAFLLESLVILPQVSHLC